MSGNQSESTMAVQAGEKDYAGCYNKALDLLSRRSHFVKELQRKLLVRGYQEADVESVLVRLGEGGFLGDEEVARQFVEGRRRRLGEVGVRLISELRKRGVDGSLASRIVGELDREGDREVALKAMDRLRARGATNEKIARHLSRKGFTKAAILAVLDRS